MNTVLRMANIELKNIITKEKLVFLTPLLLVFALSIYTGVNNYKNSKIAKIEFQNHEASYFKSLKKYVIYSVVGFNVIVEPSSTDIFFSGPPKLSDMTARVNSVATLKMNSSRDGHYIFSDISTLNISFSQFALYIGSLLVFLFGVDSFRRREHYKALSSLCKPIKLFIYIIAAKLIVLAVLFFIIFVIIVLTAQFSGIDVLGSVEIILLKYLVLTLSTFMFYLLAGTVTGFVVANRKDKKYTYGYTLAIWFFLIFVIPGIINLFSLNDSEIESTRFRLKIAKLKIINEFERKAIENHGKNADNTKIGRIKVVEHYWNDVYPKIEQIELAENQRNIKKYSSHNVRSIFFPTTFYNLSCAEMSSRGYLNYIGFHKYLIELQRGFLRFWIDRVYYDEAKKMVNFIKGDENVYKAVSMTPDYFWAGIGINLLYSFLLLLLSGFLFQRWLSGLEIPEAVNEEEVDVKLVKKIRMWCVHSDYYRNYLYALLSNRNNLLKYKDVTGTIKWWGRGNTPHSIPEGFFYLSKRENVPAWIKVKDYIKLIGSLSRAPKDRIQKTITDMQLTERLPLPLEKLSDTQFFDLQLALLALVDKKVYLIDNIMSDELPDEKAVDYVTFIDQLADKGHIVLGLTRKQKFEEKRENVTLDHCFSLSWYYDIKVLVDDGQLTGSGVIKGKNNG